VCFLCASFYEILCRDFVNKIQAQTNTLDLIGPSGLPHYFKGKINI
jgi:hypothetical protein